MVLSIAALTAVSTAGPAAAAPANDALAGAQSVSAAPSAQERHHLHGKHRRAEAATPGVHASDKLVGPPPHDGERRHDLRAVRRLGAGVEERANDAGDDKDPEAQVRTLDDDDLSVDPAPEHPIERAPHGRSLTDAAIQDRISGARAVDLTDDARRRFVRAAPLGSG